MHLSIWPLVGSMAVLQAEHRYVAQWHSSKVRRSMALLEGTTLNGTPRVQTPVGKREPHFSSLRTALSARERCSSFLASHRLSSALRRVRLGWSKSGWEGEGAEDHSDARFPYAPAAVCRDSIIVKLSGKRQGPRDAHYDCTCACIGSQLCV
jgi:hypothetical protein